MPPTAEDMAAVRRMLEAQRRQIEKLDAEQRRQMYAALEQARKELLDRLSRLPVESFSAQHYRAALAQVLTGLAELTRAMRGKLGEGAAQAYDLAAQHLGEQIATMSGRFTGTVRPNNWAPVLSVQDQVLLDRFDASVQTYGSGLIGRIQQQMAVDILAGRPWTEVARTIAGGQDGSILRQDYYGMNARQSLRQSRLERIVRTELAYAYNRAHHEDLRRADAEDPGYSKTLVSTFDDRTGQDSVFVHGQIKKLDEPFRDNQGRVYMHPPNRPNDREVEVPWRDEWGGMGLFVATPAAAERGGFVAVNGTPRERLLRDSALWQQGLTDDERRALELWTDDGYHRKIRRLLENPPKNPTPEELELLRAVKHLTSAIRKAPKVQGAVFRGLRAENLLDEKGNVVPLQAGATFGASSFDAASLEIGPAKSAATRRRPKNQPSIILVIRSRSARYIAPAGNVKYQNQQEVLFEPGARFRIIGTDERVEDGRRIIYVTVEEI